MSSLGVVVESLGTITCRETSPRTFTYDATQAFELVFNASFPEGDCVTVTKVRVYATFEPCDMETIDYATYPMTNHLVMASGMCVANSVQRDGSSLMRTCMNGTFADIPGSAGGCVCLAGYQPDSMMTECIGTCVYVCVCAYTCRRFTCMLPACVGDYTCMSVVHVHVCMYRKLPKIHPLHANTPSPLSSTKFLA